MKVVPISHTRTIKTDFTELAAYAKQHVAAIDGGTKVTRGTLLAKLLRLLPQSRFARYRAKLEAEPGSQRYPLFLVVILAAIALALATGCGYSVTALCHAAAPVKAERLCQR